MLVGNDCGRVNDVLSRWLGRFVVKRFVLVVAVTLRLWLFALAGHFAPYSVTMKRPRLPVQMRYQGKGPSGSIPAACNCSAAMYVQQPRSLPLRLARRRRAVSCLPAIIRRA